MPVRQVGHHLGEELQRDQEGVQRVVAELGGAAEDAARGRAVLLEVALEQRAGEGVLVGKW